jgi:hypothetical protein
MAMFNVLFGLLMCTLTFAEHIGHRFAAKHPYFFTNELIKDDTGLTEDERYFQDCIKTIMEKALEKANPNPQEWRQFNHKGLNKYLAKAINKYMECEAVDD